MPRFASALTSPKWSARDFGSAATASRYARTPARGSPALSARRATPPIACPRCSSKAFCRPLKPLYPAAYNALAMASLCAALATSHPAASRYASSASTGLPCCSSAMASASVWGMSSAPPGVCATGTVSSPPFADSRRYTKIGLAPGNTVRSDAIPATSR